MKHKHATAGILLAAGKSTRFGSDKLFHKLPGSGTPMAVQAARNLVQALPDSVAVIRNGNSSLEALLADTGIRIVNNSDAHKGMGSSIACGVANTPNDTGWVIALADMPYIPSGVIQQVAGALRKGAQIAAPSFNGQRGHPVGFSSGLKEELLKLQGEIGAKTIIERHCKDLQLFEVADKSILRDIDRKQDVAH